MSAVTDDQPVRCSSWARSTALDPIGTVGSYEGYLLVEAALPWPRDVGELQELAGLGVPEGYRLQALVPSSLDAPTERRRVIVHRRSPGQPFGGYERVEVERGPNLGGAVEAAIAGTETPGVDILVCTHGRRDVCCGSLGTDLALQLAAVPPRDGIRVRRTSHTGGHRFAPTFLVLPQGTAWAFASLELVHQVLDRSAPFAEVAGRYRGCAGLEGPEVQAVEREVLSEVGWELLDRPRQGFLTGERSLAGAVVRLEAGNDRWEAVVGTGRTLPVPDCLRPLSEARKSETELVVTDLRSVP